jgi:hypothetical protein
VSIHQFLVRHPSTFTSYYLVSYCLCKKGRFTTYNSGDLRGIQSDPSLMDVEIHSIITRPIQINDWNLEGSITDGWIGKISSNGTVEGSADDLPAQDRFIDEDSARDWDVVGGCAQVESSGAQLCEVERQAIYFYDILRRDGICRDHGSTKEAGEEEEGSGVELHDE